MFEKLSLFAPLFVLLLSAAPAACGSSSSPSPAARTARDIATVDERLQGAWRLVEFRPEVAPEPMFQALLAAQLGVAIVRFDHGRLYADSPNFHVTRPYRVIDANGPLFGVESPDVGGAVFTTSAVMSDDGKRITFRGNTDPWRGMGTLVRAQ
jgi:hypothetical protein